jgi:hypothetical protein
VNHAATEQKPSETFIDFESLLARVPMCERSLREAVRKGYIPSIVLPGARKRLFHWPSVEAALRRQQQTGAAAG